MALGISPDQHSPRHLHEVSEILELRREHRPQQVWPALNELLADDSSSGRHLLVLTDASGEIQWRVGSPDVLRGVDRLEFAEGAGPAHVPAARGKGTGVCAARSADA